MNEVRYHVWHKENWLGCLVQNNEDGYESYERAKRIYDDLKKESDWVILEKVTTEVLNECKEVGN